MFNHAPEDYACPFCLYAAGQGNIYVQPEHFVWTDADTFAFIAPGWKVNNPGHVLVIPKRHVENLYDLPDDLAVPLVRTMRRVAMALKQAYGCDGISLRQHNEPAGSQDVWHHHTHVFPRYHDDNLNRAAVRAAAHEEMSHYAQRLRPFLSAETHAS